MLCYLAQRRNDLDEWPHRQDLGSHLAMDRATPISTIRRDFPDGAASGLLRFRQWAGGSYLNLSTVDQGRACKLISYTLRSVVSLRHIPEAVARKAVLTRVIRYGDSFNDRMATLLWFYIQISMYQTGTSNDLSSLLFLTHVPRSKAIFHAISSTSPCLEAVSCSTWSPELVTYSKGRIQ